MIIDEKLVEKAYKKLKSSVYYDRTQLILRNRIVEFEAKHKKNIDRYFKKIIDAVRDEHEYTELSERICDGISVIAMPKKIEETDTSVIINSVSQNVMIKELQYYIDMPVEGHILGIMWIMLMGYRLNSMIYEHSYGNRIRKNLINEFSEEPTYSPYLFEPYFEQYESWRDKALSEAQKHMSEKQDVMILTLDFKRFYYSIDIDKSVMDEVFSSAFAEIDEQNYEEDYKNCCLLLNDFIGKVITEYASKFDDQFENRNILPIGFLPSNIIGNWCLHKFDKAIIDGWNPVYYGRYVDDILIVDKIERNSELFIKAKDNNLNKEDIIQLFLGSCSKWNMDLHGNCKDQERFALFKYNESITEREKNRDSGKSVKENVRIYSVNEIYNPGNKNKSLILLQNEKIKAFYFKWNESDSLITCFKNNISKNKSEFRHLPEDEAVFTRDDYSDIYSLINNDTVNKFRGIEKISIDKYELSKFLGKYLRIGGLIQDRVESRFEKDILKIFDSRAIIENYSVWEKIIEILVINERFKALELFCKKTSEAINNIQIFEQETPYEKERVQKALYMNLHACLCRSFALVWKKTRFEVQKNIYSSFVDENIVGSANELIDCYINARMIDKSVQPLMFEILNMDSLDEDSEINLTRFNDCISIIRNGWEKSDYKYYPYLIGMYEIGISSCVCKMNIQNSNNGDNYLFEELDDNHTTQIEHYLRINYCRSYDANHKDDNVVSVRKIDRNDNNDNKKYLVSVGKDKKTTLRIAVANVKLNPTNFERIIKDCPDRSYYRYKELSHIINLAIDQRVDLLIMPEAYVPFEWLPTIARTSAKSKMAIVTGVEHIKYNKKIYNYTATILPYEERMHKCSYISFHLKKHYAPSEIEKIEGYRLNAAVGNHYELYKWEGCYFPVYCCYELTSIIDRSIFQSYADMIIAVEWNRDVKYYSNILESLSRDIHCFCIQVNSSEYGDSRITKPSKSEEKDIIRTKGGINSSILVEDINILELRDFQLKEYSLQQKDKKFKATPPTFDKEIVLKKIKGEELF